MLLAIGKTDENYLETGIQKYLSRISFYIPFEWRVIPDLKNRKNLSFEQQKTMEGNLILSQLQPGDELVLLDETGQGFSSREFSQYIEKKKLTMTKRVVFVIGGPYGFSASVYAAAHRKLSLSPMTFSHQMVRLVFLEQLYRALTIIKGEPYHHD